MRHQSTRLALLLPWILPLYLPIAGAQVNTGFFHVVEGDLDVILGPTATTSPVPPSSSNFVFAHHIIGNTYNYTVDTWTYDINLAYSKGIDAFALNLGGDAWEPAQVQNAYTAAQTLQTPFKLFLSFDMSSVPCASSQDAVTLRNYISAYSSHPNQFNYNGGMFVSTFAGENCLFGYTTPNEGWVNAIKTGLPAVYFVPAFFSSPDTFGTFTVMDGAFNWNSAWPNNSADIDFVPDQSYLSVLGTRSYMAGVSPWFFTHYGATSFNKNFIYRADDWLLAQRWELLITNRAQIPFAEVITWNDYGESHYIGPIEGSNPMQQDWVNGYDHLGWLDLTQYYLTAFKTGSYPPITNDRIFLWARLQPAGAAAASDLVGQPGNWQWTQDYLWAVILLTAPSTVTLSCGSGPDSTLTSTLPSGLSKLKLPLTESCNANATIIRDNTAIISFTPPGFTFNTEPSMYNFNAFVAATPA